VSFVSFFSEKEERISGEERPFVDREEFIQAFKNALENIKEKERSVLIYYGVAGIGKTSLRKELPKVIIEYNGLHKKSSILWVAVNFETEEFRHPQKFLEILRDQFQDEYGIRFHMFDIAHALYWKKVNPRVPLYRENYSKDSIVTHLLDIGDDLSSIGGVFNPTKLLLNIRNLVKKLPEKYSEWALENTDEISRLVNMEPSEIEKRLYLYWAYDLHKYLQKTSEAAVIFIDSYEALWGKDRSLAKLSSADQWIRKLIQKLLSSSCLWVLCGQEPPQWAKYTDKEKLMWENLIETHEIGSLPEEDARYLLKYYGVLENDIQDAIINSSAGVPYYLDLSIDTYKSIKNIREPCPGDFAEVPKEVFNSFIKYLDEGKESLIKVLSVPRFWNREILNILVTKFTRCPPNEISRIHSFSFIDELEKGQWSMHRLMRQSWQEYQEHNEPEERRSVHEFMFEHYNGKLREIDIKEITLEHEKAMTEAFYHAKKTLETKDLYNWFIAASDPFDRAAFWHLITPIYEELLQIMETRNNPEEPKVVEILSNIAILYTKMGKYEKALPLHIRAIEISEKEFGSEHPCVSTTLNNLAGLYCLTGEYENALPLFIRALEISEKELKNLTTLYEDIAEHDKEFLHYIRSLEITEKMLESKKLHVATSLHNLAGLYFQTREYEKALPLYLRALEISEEVLGPEHLDVGNTLNGLALLYEHLEEYEKALPLYLRALEIIENVLGSEHPNTAKILNNLAMLYEKMGEYEKELLLYIRALEISEKVLGPEHPEVATKLHNIAGFYIKAGEYETALSLYMRTLDINTKIFGAESLNVAATLNALAGVFYLMEDYETALLLYIPALNIREKALGLENLIVAETLNGLALLYARMKEYEKALFLLERSLKILEKKVGGGHSHFKICEQNIQSIKAEMEENRNY
jgi:tetratricopeptide (TPR) repeat protein